MPLAAGALSASSAQAALSGGNQAADLGQRGLPIAGAQALTHVAIQRQQVRGQAAALLQIQAGLQLAQDGQGPLQGGVGHRRGRGGLRGGLLHLRQAGIEGGKEHRDQAGRRRGLHADLLVGLGGLGIALGGAVHRQASL